MQTNEDGQESYRRSRRSRARTVDATHRRAATNRARAQGNHKQNRAADRTHTRCCWAGMPEGGMEGGKTKRTRPAASRQRAETTGGHTEDDDAADIGGGRAGPQTCARDTWDCRGRGRGTNSSEPRAPLYPWRWALSCCASPGASAGTHGCPITARRGPTPRTAGCLGEC